MLQQAGGEPVNDFDAPVSRKEGGGEARRRIDFQSGTGGGGGKGGEVA